MQIFINESSLDSQYTNEYDLVTSIKMFLKSINRLSEHKTIGQDHFFKSEYLFYSCGFSDTQLGSSLKKNPSINLLFVQNLNKISPKVWQKEQVHDNNSTYEYGLDNYTGYSIAELTERKLRDSELKGLLLNFVNSRFNDLDQLEVVKNKSESTKVDCVTTELDIEKWLIRNSFYDADEDYDINLGLPPRDDQTVLKDKTIFERTSYPKNNGRTVYRRKGHNQLWVVDGSLKHAKSKAHIEVFDETTCKHLGTSLYNKIEVDPEYIGKNRYIRLK